MTALAPIVKVGDIIEVAIPHWSAKEGAFLTWRKAEVTKVWAHDEVNVKYPDSERHNFFLREYWRHI